MSVLKIKNGKFITIRRFQSKMLLCAVEIQDEQENAPLVHIQRQGTSRAFKFYYDHNWYWMKVVGNRLQFEKDGDRDPELFWFEREDLKSSEHYGLRFMHQSTTWYLSIKRKNQREVLTFTKKPEDCVQIRDEKRD